MITVDQAQEIIFKNIIFYGTQKVPLAQAIGRILKEDLHSDRDLPPYDRVTMDGIGIQHAAFEQGRRSFLVEGIAPAGAPKMALQSSEHCLEVMTGSILPGNLDTVIRYEDILIENGEATIQVDSLVKGQNIHRQGEDREKGSLVVPKETKLSPAEIGVAATVGKSELIVGRLPKTIIISTGDELVEIESSPLPHQIRKSNVHRIKATLSQFGIEADTHHFDDDLETIKKELATIIDNYEVILLSGGVSKGKFDFLPDALESLGVQKQFHKIKQRPGKPFWFGKAPNNTLVFALPGNPVSSFLCTHRYFLPWLSRSLGRNHGNQPFAILMEDFVFKPDLTYFLQVKVKHNQNGQIEAMPEVGNGSGDLANLVDADAFLELPRGKDLFEKGSIFPLFFYRIP